MLSFSHSWHGVLLPLTVIRRRFGTSSPIPYIVLFSGRLGSASG
jgi:hypothetical protein